MFAMGAMAAGEALACCAARTPGCWPPPDLTDPDSAIFIGTVSEILPWQEIHGGRRVLLRVNEFFAGAATPVFEVRQAGESNDVPFKLGESYFVRAHRVRRHGYWTTSVCSGSALAAASEDEITLLRRVKAGEPVAATVQGVLIDSTPRLEWAQPRAAWAGALIRLEGGGQVLETRANAGGAFSFGAVGRTKYTLSAKASGFRQSDVVSEYGRTSDPLDLSRGGCATYYVRMVSPQGAIRGHVRPAVGETIVKGLYLTIEAANPVRRQGRRTTPVRADGSFRFDQLSAGAYVVSLGRSERLHPDPDTKVDFLAAYPPVYYPGVSLESQAKPVRIRNAETVNMGTWALPRRRRARNITVQAVRTDGTPLAGAPLQVNLTWPIRSPGFPAGTTDAAGQLRFVAYQGVDYGVYAFGRSATESFDSDSVPADFGTGTVVVTVRARPIRPRKPEALP